MRLHFVLLLSLVIGIRAIPAQASLVDTVYCYWKVLVADEHADLRRAWKLEMRKKISERLDHSDRQVSIKTNIDRQAGEIGGRDESADPAAPFVIRKGDPRPRGMPNGTYWSNSGKYLYRSDTILSGNSGGLEASEIFEMVYLHRKSDGTLVAQTGDYASGSWGWDGRFVYEEGKDGKIRLKVTQGAMDLPWELEGGARKKNLPDLPAVGPQNYSRSRHSFVPWKFEDGKLYVIDEGSILGGAANTKGDWLNIRQSVDASGKKIFTLIRAHGYGENFIPSVEDPRKMWKDEEGYPIRIFDLVTREIHIRRPNGHLEKIPATTGSIAYRMDPKNPSKRVAEGVKLRDGSAANAGIVIATGALDGAPGGLAPASLRDHDLTNGVIEEERIVHMDGTVEVRPFPKSVDPATLVEGLNIAPGVIRLPNGKEFYVGTFSAGEYTAGGVRKLQDLSESARRYGVYLAFRPAETGPLGRYEIATEKRPDGTLDFADCLQEFTEFFGFGWGVGRAQAYQDEKGRWWIDAHGVDLDLLPPHLPAGDPRDWDAFTKVYRRLKLSIPIRWVEKNGMPSFVVDDPAVERALEKFREERSRILERKKAS